MVLHGGKKLTVNHCGLMSSLVLWLLHIMLCSPFRVSTAKSHSRLPSTLVVLPACTGWSGPPAPTVGSRAACSLWASMGRQLTWDPGHWGKLSVVLMSVSVKVWGLYPVTNPALLFTLLEQMEWWSRFERRKAWSLFLAWFSSAPLHIAFAGSVVG